jgi:hypothetical protein
MRVIASHLLVLVLISSASAQDQDPVIPRTILKNSPQHFGINSIKVGVERFNSTHTKSLSIFITARAENFGQNNVEGYNGLAGELQYRKYINPMKAYFTKRNKKFYQGIYAGLFAQGGNYSGKFKYESVRFPDFSYDYSENTGNWAAGFMLGYHRTFWEVIFLDVYAGGGMQWSDKVLTGPDIPDDAYYYYDITAPDYHGILPKIGVNIGITL